MICHNCGAELPDGTLVCSSCGEAMHRGERIGKSITLCDDGKYRWVYKMNIFTNPTVFFLVWKIFAAIMLGIMLIIFFSDIGREDFFPDGLLSNLKVMGLMLLGMTVLVAVGCAVWGLIYGGKYIVEFEMDEHGINHKQIPVQAEKARKIGKAAALTGAAAGSFTATGAGINSQRTEMYSDFSKVTRVKPKRRFHVIKVNEGLFHNQVYAPAEDYELVLGYITEHCPKLKSSQ